MLATSAAIPPWPLAGRVADIAQAWSLLEALNESEELDSLLQRMSVPEPLAFSRLFTAFHPSFHLFLSAFWKLRKRVWLTRRLVRHHRAQQAAPGDLAEPPLAFVEGDRWMSSEKQLEALRKQPHGPKPA